jgi:pimeloyl-ACP methyl ester carboxylesterase
MNDTNKSKGYEKFSPATTAWMKSGNYLTVDGRQIFYTDRGKGPVILLIHGHPSSCNDWEGVCDRLESQARLVAFDMIGWGLSDKPEAFSYSLFQQADVAEALLKALDITEAHVASHDLGTSVHTELLARNLEGSLSFKLLSSLITDGSILQWVSNEPPSQNLAQSNETLFLAMEEFNKVTAASYAEDFKNMTLGNLSDEAIQLKTELFCYQNQFRRLTAQSNYMRERYIHSERWVGAMEKTSPLRIAWAKDDPVATVNIGRELAQRCSQAEYVEIGGIGHFPNAENPEFVAEQVALSAGLSYTAAK